MQAVLSKKEALALDSAKTKKSVQYDPVMEQLKESGMRLSSNLNITEEHIDKALKDARKTCWKL